MGWQEDQTIKVCVKGKNCCKKGSLQLCLTLEQLCSAGNENLRVKRSKCLGLCKYAPAALVKPGGIAYGRLTEMDAEEIVEACKAGRPIARLMVERKKKKKKKRK